MTAEQDRSRREAVLAKVRAALSTGDDPAARRATVAERLAHPARSLLPERAQRGKDVRREQLKTFLEGQSAVYVEVAHANDVPVAVGRLLRAANLPLRVRVGRDAYLDGLDWTREPALERQPGRADGDDEVGLSHALAAIAETGTLMLASGADNPVTLGFVPETHVVVVEERDLVGAYEDAWDKVRARFGRGKMSRTVNLISGPSRTADIGGQLVTGAHGPRRLCVILVRDES